jgi:hypothetical protein
MIRAWRDPASGQRLGYFGFLPSPLPLPLPLAFAPEVFSSSLPVPLWWLT